jgi:DNA-binding transcriptional regulator GbsR (MarR family)
VEKGLRERQFIEQVGLILESEGLPRMAGRLLGFLLICDPPEQSSAQLVAALSASKASISTNTRLLLHTELVEKVAMPGRRGSWFRVRSNAWEQLMEHQLSAITRFRRLLDEGVSMLSNAAPERRKRLEETRDFYVFMEREYPQILLHWRQRGLDS